VPDFPGLGVAAATFEETEQLLREGIEILIDGLKEDGLPVPEPDTRNAVGDFGLICRLKT